MGAFIRWRFAKDAPGAEGIQESGAAVAQELGPPAAGMESPQLEVAAAAAVEAARDPVAVGSEKEIELVPVVVAVGQGSALLDANELRDAAGGLMSAVSAASEAGSSPLVPLTQLSKLLRRQGKEEMAERYLEIARRAAAADRRE